MMHRLTLICILVLTAGSVNAQQQVLFQSIVAGTQTTLASNAGQKHIGAVGTLGGVMYAGPYTSNRFLFQGASADYIPPAVSLVTGFKLEKNTEDLIQIQAQDAVGIVSAQLFYRPISAVGDQSFAAATMGLTGGNIYALDVPDLEAPDNWYDAMGIEYYFEVRDASNVTRYPTDGTLKAYLRVPRASIPSANFSFGDKQSNYRVITVPYELSSNEISTLFFDLGSPDKKRYRLFRYQDVFEEYPSFNTVARGQGYFIIVRDLLASGLELKQLTVPVAPSYHQGNLYQLTLNPGWNLIGNPYTVPIDWSDVEAFNNKTQLGNLKKFSSRGYTSESRLEAFEGGFVYWDDESSGTVHIPFLGQTSSTGRVVTETNTSESKGDQWILDISAYTTHDQVATGGFGMHPGASITKDSFDDLTPPFLLDQATIAFGHPEHRSKYFSQDVVPVADSYVWRMTVMGNAAESTTLNWSREKAARLTGTLYLYDPFNNVLTDMKASDQYQYQGSPVLKIYYGVPPESIGPDELSVYPPYPNPASTQSLITFSIGRASEAIVLTIYNSLGHMVYSRTDQKVEARKSLEWDGRDLHGEALAPGLYAYAIKIGWRSFAGKILLVN